MTESPIYPEITEQTPNMALDKLLTWLDGTAEMGKPRSCAESMHPIADALAATEQFLGPDRVWTFPDHPMAQTLGRALPTLQKGLAGIDPNAIKSIAERGGVEEINRFLVEHGYSVKLNPTDSFDSVSMASILDVTVDWYTRGKRAKINLPQEKKQVDGVHLRHGVRFYGTPKFPHLIAKLPTKSDTVVIDTLGFGRAMGRAAKLRSSTDVIKKEPEAGVYIARWPYAVPGDQFSCTAIATALFAEMTEDLCPTGIKDGRRVDIDGIKFPMVDFRQQGNLDWLKGASTRDQNGVPVKIIQALQEHRLRINEFGARAQSAVAAEAATLGMPPQPLVIDGPFIVWFIQKGAKLPFFAAYITSENMKDPGTLK